MANEPVNKPTVNPVPKAPIVQNKPPAGAKSAGVLTSAMAIPQEPTVTDADVPRYRDGRPIPEELRDDSLVAMPLVMPDFIDPQLANPNLSKRWINFKAGEGLRYNQCLAQGWRNATQADLKPNQLSPYKKEGGTKFINGDLILMVIDKRRYLGALKHRHQVAAALADAALLRAASGKRAANELARAGAYRQSNLNQRTGQPKVQVFAPDSVDLAGTPFEDSFKEAQRLGNDGPVDMGSGSDLQHE